ncbi:MAG TPA: peptidylprolyl isomerase, partial [Paracoccaceae bacterium]|nr:peptidylprolyl isomerase [Paracoccaceae bacterium]
MIQTIVHNFTRLIATLCLIAGGLAIALPAAAQQPSRLERAEDAEAHATAVAAANARIPLSANFDLTQDLDNIWYLDLSNGTRVAIRLVPQWAPAHVARIKELTRQGFYNGVIFHRVIDGFMAQTGDP